MNERAPTPIDLTRPAIQAPPIAASEYDHERQHREYRSADGRVASMFTPSGTRTYNHAGVPYDSDSD